MPDNMGSVISSNFYAYFIFCGNNDFKEYFKSRRLLQIGEITSRKMDKIKDALFVNNDIRISLNLEPIPYDIFFIALMYLHMDPLNTISDKVVYMDLICKILFNAELAQTKELFISCKKHLDTLNKELDALIECGSPEQCAILNGHKDTLFKICQSILMF